MSKIFILFDCPDENNDKKWLFDELKAMHSDGVYSVSINKTLSRLQRKGIVGKVQAHWLMINQCLRAIRMSKEEDIIICWGHMTGLYMNKIAMKRRDKQKMIMMNWLTPIRSNKETLQKKVITNPNTKIIVNSQELPMLWTKFFDVSITNKFCVIPDVYSTEIAFENIRVKAEKYCFTGGMNNRNWEIIIELAKKLESIEFVCVALKKDFENLVKGKIPDNVKVYYDVPSETYYTLMKNAYLVLMPLLDERVAGHINIIRAAQYGVPCIITKTLSTSQYYLEGSNMLIQTNDVETWANKVSEWYAYNLESYLEKTEFFCEYIKNEFSPNKAVKKMLELIKDFV